MPAPTTSSKASSASFAAARILSISVGVLDRAQRLDDPARRDELDVALGDELLELRVLADGQVRVVEAELRAGLRRPAGPRRRA